MRTNSDYLPYDLRRHLPRFKSDPIRYKACISAAICRKPMTKIVQTAEMQFSGCDVRAIQGVLGDRQLMASSPCCLSAMFKMNRDIGLCRVTLIQTFARWEAGE